MSHDTMDDDVTPPPSSPAASSHRLSRRGQVVLALVCIVAVAAAGIAGVLGLVQHRITSNIDYIEDPFAQITDRPTVDQDAEAEAVSSKHAPVNILVLGSDSRISAGDPTQWSYGAQRTDAIMLVHISGNRESVQVMSIPRDSWVSIPGHGQAKLNAAYSWGGPSLMIQAVEQLTGVRIDHIAIADFESFAALTDQLGGVEITLPEGMNNDGIALAAGTYVMTGDQALAYVRERYDLPGGDFDRVQRQQNWMRAIMRTAFSNGVLANPLALTEFLETAADALAVDDGFTASVMRDLALSMVNLRPGTVTFLTVPVAGTGWSDNGQSIVNLDRDAFDELMAAVADDDVAHYVETHSDLVLLPSAGEVR